MEKMLVGNTPIGSDEGLFEQECECNQFPCKHYRQIKKTIEKAQKLGVKTEWLFTELVE